MIRKTAPLLACALLLPLLAQAQERTDDIFRWLPQGSYQKIIHRNDEALGKAGAYALFLQLYTPAPEAEKSAEEKGEHAEKIATLKMLGNPAELRLGLEQLRDSLELPSTLRQHVYWSTTAVVLELDSLPDDKGKPTMKVKEPNEKGERAGLHIDFDKEDPGRKIAVYRVDDPTALERALESGELVSTGKKLLGRALYTFGIVDKGEREGGTLLWVSADGDILTAVDRKLLAQMIYAGRGRVGNIVNSPRYPDLAAVVPDLGQVWELTHTRFLSNAVTSAANEGTVDAEMEAKLAKLGKGSPLYRAKTLTVDDEVRYLEVAVYEDDDQAQAAFEGKSTDLESMLADLSSLNSMAGKDNPIGKAKKRELHDNKIVSRLTITPELLAKHKASQGELMKELKLKLKEADDDEDDDHEEDEEEKK